MSSYVSKNELSNAGYITSIPNTYASYNGVYSYLESIGITRKNNGASFIDSAYITDSELSGDIWINGISTWQLPTYAAISAMGYLTSIPSEYVTDTELSSELGNYYTMGEVDSEIDSSLSNYYTKTEINNASYVTSSALPVINENLIPKETNTYTLGDASNLYAASYTQSIKINHPSRAGWIISSEGSGNELQLKPYNTQRTINVIDYYGNKMIRMYANNASTNYSYSYCVTYFDKPVYFNDTTYTSNLYSGKSSIKMNDRNVDIWANNKKLINASDYGGVVPTQTNFSLGSSSNKWGSTYTTDLYADNIHNFIWIGTSAEYAALSDYTTYQIYMIKES